VGGLFPFAGVITGEGEPYRPDVLVWLDGRGVPRAMEVDELREGMDDEFGGSDGLGAYLDAGLAAPAVASLFEAAAGLFRTAPWKVVPDDMPELLVSSPGPRPGRPTRRS